MKNDNDGNKKKFLKRIKYYLMRAFVQFLLPTLTRVLDFFEKALTEFKSHWPNVYQVFFASGLFYTLLISGITLIIAELCR